LDLETTEMDVDKLLADVENPPAEETPAPAAQEQQWNGAEWEFDWNGKKIVPDSRDKIKTWMSQGYNYSQRMGELNKTHAQRMAEAESRAKQAAEIESRYKPYAEIDEYAAKNKDWWDHVTKSYQNREVQGVDPNIANIVQPLRSELDEIKQFVNQQREAAQQAEFAKQDELLESEIESIRKSHPNIDLSARDDSGETLERRVLLHAQELGTNSFRAAFRDYLHDQLVTQQQAQVKLQAVKGVQAQAKAGVLGKTTTPTKELKAVDTRRPWNDPQFDVQTILEELRQNGG
jgi:hypothetical protein